MRVLKFDVFSFACLLFCLIMMFEKVKYEYLIFGFSNKKKKYSVTITNLEKRKYSFVLHGQDSVKQSVKDYKCFFYQYSEFHVFTRQSSVENCYNMGYNCYNE